MAVYGVISILVFGYAAVGLFVSELRDKLTEVDIGLTTSTPVGHVTCLLQVNISYSDKVWNLLQSVFRVSFLTNDQCCKHVGTLHKTRVKSTRIISTYAIVDLTLTQQWTTFPFAYNKFVASNGANRKLMNVYNLRFPVSTDAHNEYYNMIFFTLEFLAGSYLGIIFFLNDMILLCFCWIIIVQHDVLVQSFQEVGHGKTQQTGKF